MLTSKSHHGNNQSFPQKEKSQAVSFCWSNFTNTNLRGAALAGWFPTKWKTVLPSAASSSPGNIWAPVCLIKFKWNHATSAKNVTTTYSNCNKPSAFPTAEDIFSLIALLKLNAVYMDLWLFFLKFTSVQVMICVASSKKVLCWQPPSLRCFHPTIYHPVILEFSF